MTGKPKKTVMIGAAVMLVTAIAAGTYVLTRTDNSTAQVPVLPPATTTVKKTTLAASTEIEGTIGYGRQIEVSSTPGGTITAIAATGAIVKRGEALYKIDQKPVVLLYGDLPPYRKLSTGSEGGDVRQLEQNLAELGYAGFTVDEEYTSATATAVREWQKDLAIEETGQVEASQVAVARGAVRIAAQSATPGQSAGGPVLKYTGTTRVVTVNVPVGDQELAVVGATVSLTLPDGEMTTGKIASRGKVATAAPEGDNAPGGQEKSATIEVVVTVSDQKMLGDFDQAPVDVGLTAEKREGVLVVPVAALLALPEGGYGLEVVEGQATRIVPVKVGMFSDGMVEVSGAEVAEGVLVGMPK